MNKRQKAAAIAASAFAALQVVAAIDRTDIVATVADKAGEIILAVAKVFGLFV